jgi:hypothetical protein
MIHGDEVVLAKRHSCVEHNDRAPTRNALLTAPLMISLGLGEGCSVQTAPKVESSGGNQPPASANALKMSAVVAERDSRSRGRTTCYGS